MTWVSESPSGKEGSSRLRGRVGGAGHGEEDALKRLCWWVGSCFAGALICQVTPCWSWVEKRINMCESSNVQEKGQEWFKVQSRREKGHLGLAVDLWPA